MIVPANTAEVSSMLATAFSLYDQTKGDGKSPSKG
jgi:hypothetical protein